MNFTSQGNQLDKRASWADLCRVVAIFGVVLIHACGAAALYQYGKIPQMDWLSANFLDSLVRCSVPLFVMLSGALLLKPGETPVTIRQIARRVNKVLFPLLTWNVAYLLYVSYRCIISGSYT
jgi:surface polysaccharide O-acyltransferase-like enzyme